MKRLLWAFLTFIAVSVVVGFVYWRQTDWWCYVDMTASGRGMVPKFMLTPLEQFVVSSLVGMTVGGAVAGVLFAVSVWATRSDADDEC